MSSLHANALTARWAARLDDRQTVFCGAGAYPLLALRISFCRRPALRVPRRAPSHPPGAGRRLGDRPHPPLTARPARRAEA
ncbi:hypothetical protein [Micromonospora sp. DT47]|uniref:hypothetical protein n=1 Tax=Micromonospora sp. DT47 TaxID=3393431 RepID=UPI003CEF2F75